MVFSFCLLSKSETLLSRPVKVLLWFNTGLNKRWAIIWIMQQLDMKRMTLRGETKGFLQPEWGRGTGSVNDISLGRGFGRSTLSPHLTYAMPTQKAMLSMCVPIRDLWQSRVTQVIVFLRTKLQQLVPRFIPRQCLRALCTAQILHLTTSLKVKSGSTLPFYVSDQLDGNCL